MRVVPDVLLLLDEHAVIAAASVMIAIVRCLVRSLIAFRP